MVAEVNADILGKERMNVRVMDENTTRADSVLGVGTVSLRKLCPRINSTVELSVDLVAENGAAVGTVLVTAVLTESRLEDLADALPESAVVVKRGQLVVRKITALDLKGGDTTFFGGKQVLKLHEPIFQVFFFYPSHAFSIGPLRTTDTRK